MLNKWHRGINYTKMRHATCSLSGETNMLSVYYNVALDPKQMANEKIK